MRDDHELIRQCQEGDMSAFRTLVERYETRIYTLACSIVGDREAARDAAQEAFVRAYSSLSAFRGQSGFYTWLYRIAVNVSLNAAQKESRRLDRASLDALMETGGVSAGDLFSPATADSDLERAEVQDHIQSVLNTLSADHRAVVVLKDIEGLSQEEIAEALNCSVGTVKSRLSRARKRLQELLRPFYNEWIGSAPA